MPCAPDWKCIEVYDLVKALQQLPAGSRLGVNAQGNLTIVNAFGDYVGYVDFKRGNIELLDNLL